MTDLNNEKIIIECHNIPLRTALAYVTAVVDLGKVSETSMGEQYCFHSHFKDSDVDVSVVKNKRSERFVVTMRSNDGKS